MCSLVQEATIYPFYGNEELVGSPRLVFCNGNAYHDPRWAKQCSKESGGLEMRYTVMTCDRCDR